MARSATLKTSSRSRAACVRSRIRLSNNFESQSRSEVFKHSSSKSDGDGATEGGVGGGGTGDGAGGGASKCAGANSGVASWASSGCAGSGAGGGAGGGGAATTRSNFSISYRATNSSKSAGRSYWDTPASLQ